MRSALLCFTLLAVSSTVPGLAAPIRPPPSDPARSSPSDHGSGLTGPAIGGIAAGAGVLATAAAVGGVYLHKKKKATLLKNNQKQKPETHGANDANDAHAELHAETPGGVPLSNNVQGTGEKTVSSVDRHTPATPPAAHVPPNLNLNPAAVPVSQSTIPKVSSHAPFDMLPYQFHANGLYSPSQVLAVPPQAGNVLGEAEPDAHYRPAAPKKVDISHAANSKEDIEGLSYDDRIPAVRAILSPEHVVVNTDWILVDNLLRAYDESGATDTTLNRVTWWLHLKGLEKENVMDGQKVADFLADLGPEHYLP